MGRTVNAPELYDYWAPYLLNREESKYSKATLPAAWFSLLWRKTLQLQSSFQQHLDSWKDEHFSPVFTIGIHIKDELDGFRQRLSHDPRRVALAGLPAGGLRGSLPSASRLARRPAVPRHFQLVSRTTLAASSPLVPTTSSF